MCGFLTMFPISSQTYSVLVLVRRQLFGLGYRDIWINTDYRWLLMTELDFRWWKINSAHVKL